MASENNDKTKRLRIRKYPNRRYYDSTRGCHVTLEQIHSLIRDGYEVEVTDSKSGTDITAKVLAQIILDLDSPKLDVFPVPLLHRLIQSNQGLVQDFTEKYFSQALSAFLASQKESEAYLRQVLGLDATTAPRSGWPQTIMGLFAPPFWTGSSQPAPATPSNNSSDRDVENLRPIVEELRRQVAALQQQLAEKQK